MGYFPESCSYCRHKLTSEYGHRFHDIAWVQPKGFSTGVVAGALENGSLDLWDAGKLLDGDE